MSVLRGLVSASDNSDVWKPRISLKQLLGVTAVASVIAWCAGGYESWYGIRWTPADSAMLSSELANLDGEITEGLATRVAINEAVSRGGRLRILPDDVRRGVWTRRLENGKVIDPVDVGCFIVYLEDIPEGIGGAFTRIRGGHCIVYVGLDGSVLAFMGGA